MKKARNMIAFDLGASNGRAILGRFDGEKITMQELHRFENNYIEIEKPEDFPLGLFVVDFLLEFCHIL